MNKTDDLYTFRAAWQRVMDGEVRPLISEPVKLLPLVSYP
jgi:hypothetical protein